MFITVSFPSNQILSGSTHYTFFHDLIDFKYICCACCGVVVVGGGEAASGDGEAAGGDGAVIDGGGAVVVDGGDGDGDDNGDCIYHEI